MPDGLQKIAEDSLDPGGSAGGSIPGAFEGILVAANIGVGGISAAILTRSVSLQMAAPDVAAGSGFLQRALNPAHSVTPDMSSGLRDQMHHLHHLASTAFKRWGMEACLTHLTLRQYQLWVQPSRMDSHHSWRTSHHLRIPLASHWLSCSCLKKRSQMDTRVLLKADTPV